MSSTIDIVLPAYNEGESIGQTLQELYNIVTVRDGLSLQIIVCEDGSTDDTVAMVRKVSETLPVLLISEGIRKGYSKAVIDGLKATKNSFISFIDSDGQCDPRDFKTLYDHLIETDCDLVVGYRNPRRDHWIRQLMSFFFGLVYKYYFKSDLLDPSSPYLIIRRPALDKILMGNLGILKQGFWWEFYARAFAYRLKIKQVPITHRLRTFGTTQVYQTSKVPRIAWEHLRGLSRLRQELAKLDIE